VDIAPADAEELLRDEVMRAEMMRSILAPRVSSGRIAFEARLVQKVSRRSVRAAFAQRVFDLVVATAALVVTSPVFAACALAVRLTSRGPVIFRQIRIGQRGQPFSCLKFRTMCVDAEERLAAILLEDEEARSAFEAVFKLDHDPRITRVGRFLRASASMSCPSC